MSQHEITPELILYAYKNGVFPMAETKNSTIVHWYKPHERGVFLLEKNHFHIATRLKRKIRNKNIRIEIDNSFDTIVDACANPHKYKGKERSNTWINKDLKTIYTQLFEMHHAHSIEVYIDDVLAGGLFGIAIQGCFFGESMFSLQPDASKIALFFLLAKLITANFTFLDAQFPTAHLTSLGLQTLNANTYEKYLHDGLEKHTTFNAGKNYSGSELVQFFNQMS